jgi:RNA polymerase sigma factor (TIGR02999 family)
MNNRPTAGAASAAEVTQLLLEWKAGDDNAFEKLAPVVYAELRRMARRYMAGERSGHTLQPSALVNEAFLKLIDSRRVGWQNRAHFFAISAQLMRRILVDFARRKRDQKRGGNVPHVTFCDELPVASDAAQNLMDIDDSMKALAALDPRVERVVELRYFGGLSVEETAEVLQVSSDTVLRDWKFAKAWLQRELSRGRGRETSR